MKREILCIESLAGSFQESFRIGVYTKIVKELNYLAKKEGHVYYLSKDTKKVKLGKNITHVCLSRNTPIFFKNFAYLFYPIFNLKIFRKSNIYYIHHISGAFPAVIAKKILGNKKIVSKYDWNWSFTFKRKYNYFIYIVTKILEYVSLKYSDTIIASSPRLKREIVKINKDFEKKTKVVPLWVDRGIFKPSKKKKRASKKPVLVSVGRLDKGKNQILILESVKIMKSIGIDPFIIMVGDGEERKKLIQYSKKNKIKMKIIRNISNNRLPEILRKSDVFIMSSKYEGFPQVVIEALSCGLPFVGINVRGVNDIIKNNYNGVLCKNNADEIARNIISIINDKQKYSFLRNNAIKSVKAYDFDKIMKKTYRIIKNEK